MAALLEKLNAAFVADPAIDEYAFVPAATPQLFSPGADGEQDLGCVHAEHKLAISIEAALALYLHAYQVSRQAASGYSENSADTVQIRRIHESSRAILLCSADCSGAWNAWNRTRSSSLSPKAGLLFSALLLRTNHKSGETWAQRRKLLGAVLRVSQDEQQTLLCEELALLEELARRYDHHYYAWNHWAWLNRFVAESPGAASMLEKKFPKLAFQTPSHYGLFHHRLVRLQRQLSKQPVAKTSFNEEWQLAGELLATFPHLEAPWAFRGQLMSLMLEFQADTSPGDVASAWRSEVAFASRHVQSSPPINRLAMQFQILILQELCLHMMEMDKTIEDTSLLDDAESLLENLKASQAAAPAVLLGITADLDVAADEIRTAMQTENDRDGSTR
ncbi:ptar1 [Symbiodinium necroappetens]|uniref:Ptar1 protein n=1 Tax=Symbiodinium necroappetens TaxID=1628268 RepID=A0A812ZER1_9DINO|nr:ptar1 [Symbiodinium necroappetens]